MGSLLLERSGVFASSESFNVTSPDLVKQIHLDYISAGSDVTFANTFGCNPYRGADYARLIDRALTIAFDAVRESQKDVLVALDVGPTGKIIGKAGIGFDQAYESFAQVVRAAGDREDLVVIETMTDLTEARAAILAAKDNTTKPIAVSMSFERGGHSAFGCSVESFALTATALGVDAVGINCSLGPAEMAHLYQTLRDNTHLPVFVKPNAGMPEIYKGKSIYNLTAERFAAAMVPLYRNGADMLGGCCGTTPAYIAALKKALDGVERTHTAPYAYTGKLCSQTRAVLPTQGAIIGERINPTGKKVLQEALRTGDVDYVVALGPKQEDEGALLLDVNLGMSGLDDATYMQEVVEHLQSVTNTPLVIDSSSAKTIEIGLRHFAGRAMVNSVNGEDAVLDAILPLVKRYGAAVIGLTLDRGGIPTTISGRVAIARKIVERAVAYGIDKQDVYIDCLTMAEGAGKGNARLTVDSLREVKKLGCRTVLGVSNISYGMPAREDLNAAFLAMALEAGLDACIVNPLYKGLRASQAARDYLEGKAEASDYILFANTALPKETAPASTDDVESAVRRGDVKAVRTLIGEAKDRDEASATLIKALDTVGQLYEQGKYFLPQLIAAAEAAKAGFDVLFAKTGEARESKGKLVLATVKGDVHDIGKNIVKSVVANYGYRVIDLGKDVPADKVLQALRREMPCVLGLSALMTTTAANMAEIVNQVRAVYPTLPILVGGAVITPAFAADIGCIYCKDAAASVKEMGKLCQN